MRVTVDRSDPDFIGEQNYGRYEAQYRGKKLDDCIEADDVKGYAIVSARRDDGHLDVDYETDKVRTIRVEGDIRIIDKRAA